VRFSLPYFILFSIIFLSLPSCFNAESDGASNTKNSGPDITYPGNFKIKGIAMVATVKKVDTKAIKKMIETNANYVALMPYAFCSEENTTVRFNIERQWWGEKEEGISETIDAASMHDLQVMVKPHIWFHDVDYSGDFKPDNEEEWKKFENSFFDYIICFAKIAEEKGAKLFCIGTELRQVVRNRPGYWQVLIDSVRKIYTGQLTYAANWDDYEDVPFWDQLDYIGIDAYFPLSLLKTPSVKEIQEGWKKYEEILQAFSEKHNKPILFTEFGYRNASFCAAYPWEEKGRDINNQAQANAYEGLFKTFAGKPWFAGGFAWKWYADNAEKHLHEIDYTPQQKPAFKILQTFYGVHSPG
jgi:hypothetical protein